MLYETGCVTVSLPLRKICPVCLFLSHSSEVFLELIIAHVLIGLQYQKTIQINKIRRKAIYNARVIR